MPPLHHHGQIRERCDDRDLEVYRREGRLSSPWTPLAESNGFPQRFSRGVHLAGHTQGRRLTAIEVALRLRRFAGKAGITSRKTDAGRLDRELSPGLACFEHISCQPEHPHGLEPCIALDHAPCYLVTTKDAKPFTGRLTCAVGSDPLYITWRYIQCQVCVFVVLLSNLQA